jgi:hypothetical protein
LYINERTDGETFEEFCARLMQEFRDSLDNGIDIPNINLAQIGEHTQVDPTTVHPLDEVPEGCVSGVMYLEMLTSLTDQIRELYALMIYLEPRKVDPTMCDDLPGTYLDIIMDIFEHELSCLHEKM